MNRITGAVVALALLAGMGCRSQTAKKVETAQAGVPAGSYLGFDRNLYPGDDRLAQLRGRFSFVGFWLNVPPGMSANTWGGKRKVLRDSGFGFLVLSNGRLEEAIDDSEMSPEELGRADAAVAVANAAKEGFPKGTVIFLDQEEGGRLTEAQAGYFFAWTEAVAASQFKPGSYLSGQQAPDGNGPDGKPVFITTAQDVRQTIAAKKLHSVVLWVAQDTCPPAPGCTVTAVPKWDASGSMDAPVWQYAQSPRRPDRTKSCAASYAADGLCYAGLSTDLFVDLDVANSADPSSGR